MMRKIKFNCESDEAFINNYDFMEGIIYDANIKPAKIVAKKEINKKGIPFIKNITIWRVFIDIKLEDGFCISCIWNLEDTFYIHDMIPVINVKKSKKKKKAKNKIKEPVIPTIFRACGVNEWSELIGTTVLVRDTFGWHSTNKFIHGNPCISPLNERGPVWFYPNYFQTDIESDDDSIDCNVESKNESIVNSYEMQEDPINSDCNSIEEFLDNIIKEKDGCIFKDYQDEFKNTITSLIKSEYGYPGNPNNKPYGLSIINSVLKSDLKLDNIKYTISIVYKTKTTPRYWKINKVEESE